MYSGIHELRTYFELPLIKSLFHVMVRVFTLKFKLQYSTCTRYYEFI